MFIPLQNTEQIQMGSTSTIPLQMIASTESLRISGSERNTSIWYLLKHNWRQLTSLVPGLILLCASGSLHCSWTIVQMLKYVYEFREVQIGIVLAWFLGVAFGGIFGCFLNSCWSKICIYYSIAVACVPVSIIFVIHQTSPYNLLLIGRCLAGTLYGSTLITIVLHIADNSSQFMRRYFLWTVSMITIIPSFLFAESLSNVTNIYDVNATIGGVMFVLAILALIFMPCTYESIIFLLENGNDLRALEILISLRNESRHFIRRDFNEFKMMLAEDYSDDKSNCRNGNTRPLLLLLLLRLLNALLANGYIYWIFLANIWIDYRNWTMHSLKAAADVFAVRQSFTSNGTLQFDLPDGQNETTTTIENENLLVSAFENIMNTTTFENVTDALFDAVTTEVPFDETAFNDTDTSTLLPDFNETMDDLLIADTDIITTNITSIVDHFFVHSSYAYRLPELPIYQFLLVVFAIKVLAGMPLMCVAEKFKIYRNRIIFKAVLCIGILNLIFFSVTLICYRVFDDSSLIFTFYLAKLLTIIYCGYLLVTFCVDTIGYCELAESFSLTKRYGAIAFIAIGEHLVHALFILLILSAEFRFYFHVLQSIAITIISYFLLRSMPAECLDSTLRGARDKYFVKKVASTNQ